MSAGKKNELMERLTRRDAQRPPMETTYENKGTVLEAFGLSEQNSKSAEVQNSKSAKQQNYADAEEKKDTDAKQQIVVPIVTSQEALSPEEQIDAAGRELAAGAPVEAKQQTFVDAKAQSNKEANQQIPVDADMQSSKNAEEQNSKSAKMRRITFHIPEETFKQLKLISLEEDLTMLEIGAQMAEEYIARKRKQ